DSRPRRGSLGSDARARGEDRRRAGNSARRGNPSSRAWLRPYRAPQSRRLCRPSQRGGPELSFRQGKGSASAVRASGRSAGQQADGRRQGEEDFQIAFSCQLTAISQKASKAYTAKSWGYVRFDIDAPLVNRQRAVSREL